MWRFSLSARDAAQCSNAVLVASGVEQDDEFARLICPGDSELTVFVVREGCPRSIREALHFLLGVCTAAPKQLWFEQKEVDW
jgi:hypothetical protein